MKMENQYKSEAELYVLANTLKQADGKHSKNLLLSLSPIGWDNEVLIGYLVKLSKKIGFGIKNLTCDIKFWDDILPRVYEKMQRVIKDDPKSEHAQRQKRFLENKFSVADIEKELASGTFDDALDKILGDGQSLFQTISFDFDISEKSKRKITIYLSEYLKKFINDGLVIISEKVDINDELGKSILGMPRNVYTFKRHKDIIFEVFGELRKNHGIKFLVKEKQIPSTDANFLFVHIILALEQLGYITVALLGAHDAEEHRMARYRTKDGEPIIKDVSSYEAWVQLTPKFLKEVEVKNNQNGGKRQAAGGELYLNSVGDLWREPKTKYNYSLGENSGRHKIVRFFATHGGYQKTSDIAMALEGKDEQLIRKEIGKIRGNIKKFLKLNGKDVIEMRKGSGYRIGPAYKIIPKN